MALATNGTPGEIVLNGDFHGSSDALQPELTPTGVAPGKYILPSLVVDTKGRVLTMKNADAISVPCATPVSCGVVVVGININVSSATISIPFGSGSSLGRLQAGTGLSAVNGVVSLNFSAATTTTIGQVIVPSAGNIDVAGNGSISIPPTSLTTFGVLQAGTDISIDVAGEMSVDLPPTATDTIKGLVSIGNNIDVLSGQISVPIATAVSVGVLKIDTTPVGSPAGNLAIDGAGELSYVGVVQSPPAATTTAQGFIIVPTAGNIDVDVLGNISIPVADNINVGVISLGTGFETIGNVLSAEISTNIDLGVVRIGSQLNIDIAGEITADLNIATPTVIGSVIVPAAGYIDVDGNGAISVPLAQSDVSVGLVKSTNTGRISISSGLINLGADIPKTNVDNTWNDTNSNIISNEAWAASMSLDGTNGSIFVITLSGSTLITDITNKIAAQQYTLIIIQDVTGGHALNFSTVFKFNEDGITSNLKQDPGTETIISCHSDGSVVYCNSRTDFKTYI